MIWKIVFANWYFVLEFHASDQKWVQEDLYNL